MTHGAMAFAQRSISRSDEHAGCYLTASRDLLKGAMEKYNMNILIVHQESRIRKREHWRNGREEESFEGYSLMLLR